MTKTRRRTRRSLDRYLVAGLIVATMLVLVLQALPWLISLTVVAVAAYAIGRHHGITLAAGRAPVKVELQPRADRRAERNGWVEPPARTVLLSAACAGADCGICTDRTCQHGCGHPALHRSPPAQPQTRTEVPF